MKKLFLTITLLFFALTAWGLGDSPPAGQQDQGAGAGAGGGGAGAGGGGGAGGAGSCEFVGPEGTLKQIIHNATGQAHEECFEWNEKKELTRHRNLLGAEITQEWDDQGRLRFIRDPHVNTTEIQYDSASRYSGIYHQIQNGRVLGDSHYRVNFQYDSVGNMKRTDIGGVISPASYSQQKYSPDEELKASSGPGNLGSCVSERDPSGRVKKMRRGIVNPDSGTCEGTQGEISYDYSPAGLLNAVSDADGHKKEVLERDGFDRPTRVKLPSGAIVVSDYNLAGLVKKVELYGSGETQGADARVWRSIEMDYDVMGRLIRTDEKNIARGMSPQALGNQSDRITNYSYEISPTGSRVITRRNGVEGGELNFVSAYDSMERLIREESPESPPLTISYDNQARTVQTRLEGSEVVTTSTFDLLGQLVQKTYPGSWWEHFAYDSRGMLTEVRRLGAPYRLFTSDMLGRIRKIERTGGGQGATWPEAVIDYNENGQLSALKANRNVGWSWVYDGGGRLSRLVDPVGNNARTITEYNPRGLVSGYTDGRGTTFTLEYDPSGSIIGIYARLSNGDQYQRQYTYNPRGDLEWVGETTGGTVPEAVRGEQREPKPWNELGPQHPVEVNLETDSLGRRSREEINVNGTSYAVTSTHNNLDLIETQTYSGGHFIDYDYTNGGNLLRIKVYNRAGGNQIWQTELTYDAEKGRYTRETRQNGGSVVTVGYFYDHLDRLRGIGGDIDISYPAARYGFGDENNIDPLGYVVGKRLTIGPDVPDAAMRERFFYYQYDADGRLLVANKLPNLASFQSLQIGQWNPLNPETTPFRCTQNDQNECFQIDLSNRVSRFFDTTKTSFVYADDESLREMTTHRRCTRMDLINGNHDCAQPNADRITFRTDRNGNLVSINRGNAVVRSFDYDPWDRMIKATLNDKNLQIYYDYDGLDRLVRRRVMQKRSIRIGGRSGSISNSWVFAGGDVFVWDGPQIVEIRSVNASSQPSRKSYVYGIMGTPMMSVDQSDRIEQDFRGLDGTLHAVRMIGGTLAEWYQYRPYGEVKAYMVAAGRMRELTTAPRNPFLFKGFYRDPSTGFYWAGTRWYNSDWGRFLTRHPGGVSVGRINLYTFSNHEPVAP